jgi:ABC-type glycerol-3-phosphate transport system substrate-binding protein
MSGAVLAACGQGGATQPAAQNKGPVTIEVLTRNGVAAPDGHSQFYDKRAKQLFTPASNITVNFLDAQPDVGERLTVMATAGQLPDGSWFGVVADGFAGREQAEKAIFKPMDDIIKKDNKFDIKPYFKAMLDAFTVGGKLYALPTHAHYGTHVLYYNKGLTDAAGVKVPDDGNWTHDEMLAAAQKITRRGEDIWGYWPEWGVPEFGAFWARQFGGEYLSADGKRSMLDTPEARASLEWQYNAATKAQVINDLFRTVEGAPLNQTGRRGLFGLGKLAMFATTPGLVASYRNPAQQEVKFPVGIALFPKSPQGRRGTQASGSGMGITNTAKQDAVWEWIKFATDKDNGVEQVFGGAGSPGGRTDAWNDAKLLKERDPIYQTIIKAFPQGAGALHLAANNRYSFVNKAVNDELNKYFRGEVSLADGAKNAVQAATVELTRT